MKVKFLPDGREEEIKPNQSVLELAKEKGIKIHTICHGLPSCAECRVKLVEGEHNVLPPNEKELSLIGTGHFIDQRRLSCQLRCFGDIVVDITEQLAKTARMDDKRPSGNLRKDDAEKSYSVTGSLIEQEAELVQKTQSEREETRPQDRPRRPNNRNRNRNRPNNNTNQNKPNDRGSNNNRNRK